MTSSNFDSSARDHAKCQKAGNEAAAFWMWSIQWSRKNGTHGFLEEGSLHTIPPTHIKPALAKKLADACVGAVVKKGGVGLLERVEGGYQIHDFVEWYQPDDEEAAKERARVRMRDVRANDRAHKQRTLDELHGHVGDAFADGSRSRAAAGGISPLVLSGSDPDPTGDPDGSSNRARGGRGSRLPAGWAPTDVDRAFAAKRGWGDERIADEATHFAAHHTAKGTASKSWAASWMTWVMQSRRWERGNGTPRSGVQRAVQPAPLPISDDDAPTVVR